MQSYGENADGNGKGTSGAWQIRSDAAVARDPLLGEADSMQKSLEAGIGT